MGNFNILMRILFLLNCLFLLINPIFSIGGLSSGILIFCYLVLESIVVYNKPVEMDVIGDEVVDELMNRIDLLEVGITDLRSSQGMRTIL